MEGTRDCVQQCGWDHMIDIPVNRIDINLLMEYSRVDMDSIQTHAQSYIGTNTRNAQNNVMMYHFLMDLVRLKFKAKILLHTNEYMIGNTPSSTCLLKNVVQLT